MIVLKLKKQVQYFHLDILNEDTVVMTLPFKTLSIYSN